MKTVVLVGCGKKKLAHAAPAKDLYTGDLFRKARAYAERVGDDWGILSAKHWLLLPDQVVEPYDLCLDDLDRDQLRAWVFGTQFDIYKRWPEAKFICLAGELYGQVFGYPRHLEVEFPMAGMGLGKRLQWLSRA